MTTYTSKLGRNEIGWFIRENKVVNLPIGYVAIKSSSNENGTPCYERITYGFRIIRGSNIDWVEMFESEIFATKEELLASL